MQDSCLKDLPGISVVIPAYNYQDFVSDAIDSSLAQDYPRLEVIVVNDGSTDNTGAICESYGNRIHYIVKENAGLSAARNTGIEAAQYDYIAFMDADDAYCPGALRTLMEKLQQLGPEFVCVGSQSMRILPDGSNYGPPPVYSDEGRELTASDFFLCNRFPPSTVLIKKAVFKQVGYFDISLKSSEDRDMWLRAATVGRVYRIHKNLAKIRRHGANMSRNAERMCSTKLKVLQRARDLGVSTPRTWALNRKAKAFFHFEAAQLYRVNGEYGRAIWRLIVSIYWWPWFGNPSEVEAGPLFRLRQARLFTQRYRTPAEIMKQKYGDNPIPTPGHILCKETTSPGNEA